MTGWGLGIPVLTSILPGWATMEFSTALCFVFSAAVLLLISEAVDGRDELARVLLPIGNTGILLLMGVLLVSTLLNVRTGVEELFVRERADAVQTTISGRPSVGTMVGFLLVAAAGMLAMLHAVRFVAVLRRTGGVVACIGLLAVAGHVLDAPALYFEWEGVSSAMAVHGAALLLLLGLGLLSLGPAKGAAAAPTNTDRGAAG